VFVDVGAVFGVRQPTLIDIDPNSALAQNECTAPDGTVNLRFTGCITDETLTRGAITPFRELFLGDTPSPRLSVGIGVNWNSPFGPFRINVAYDVVSYEGDDPKLFSFNVGTQF
jgi:outer membrane protein insertion porin family